MKFFLFFAAIIAVCSASGLIGYGHGIVAAPVTSVTHRQDIYGAKVIAAPVLAAPVYHGGVYNKGLYGGHYGGVAVAPLVGGYGLAHGGYY